MNISLEHHTPFRRRLIVPVDKNVAYGNYSEITGSTTIEISGRVIKNLGIKKGKSFIRLLSFKQCVKENDGFWPEYGTDYVFSDTGKLVAVSERLKKSTGENGMVGLSCFALNMSTLIDNIVYR